MAMDTRRDHFAHAVGELGRVVDGMLFAQSRIAMNDTYVGGLLLLAYVIFALLWLDGGKRRYAFWLGMPLLGVVLDIPIPDNDLTRPFDAKVRKELRQFGVHVTRCKLVDFADCKVFKLLTSQADRQGMATHQLYQ